MNKSPSCPVLFLPRSSEFRVPTNTAVSDLQSFALKSEDSFVKWE